MQTRPRPPFALLAALLAVLAPAGFAASFIVIHAEDSGIGSLRQAIISANAAGGGPHTITFDGTAFNAAGQGVIILSSALPDVACDLTITGPGADAATISGTSNGRLMKIGAGRTVAISGLTFLGGMVQGGNGSPGVNAGTPPTAGGSAQGGAIFNSGSLTLMDCLVSDCGVFGGYGGSAAGNFNQAGAAGGTALGGAIYSDGTSLALVRCTLTRNVARAGFGGGGANIIFGGGGSGPGGAGGHARGGAVYVAAGTVSAQSCTFAANECTGGAGGNGGASNFSGGEQLGGAGGDGEGGAIYANPALVMISCTVAQNTVQAGPGGLQVDFSQNAASGVQRGGGTLLTLTSTVGNTIVATNVISPSTPSDVLGAVSSSGFNLVGASDGSSGFTAPTDQTGTAASPLDPKLDSHGLQRNGGTMPTIRIVSGSPAADKGKDLLAGGKDQRGLMRPVDLVNAFFPNAAGGDGSDIGAFESQNLPNTRPDALLSSVSGRVGAPLSGQSLSGSDADGNTLTYALANGSTLPDGLSLNPATGAVTGTPSTPGQATVYFTVSDPLETSVVGFASFNIVEAKSLVVTTASDVIDIYDGLVSLREAINYAATLTGTPAITFDASVFGTPKTIAFFTSIQSTKNFTLTGSAAGVTIDGNHAQSLFRVNGGTVTFNQLTFARGASAVGLGGGALRVGTGATVNVTGCTFARCGANANSAPGGAVRNTGGTLTLTNCTFAGNSVNAPGSAGAAIRQDSGTTSVLNCTITDNSAFTGGDGEGGGISIGGGTLSLGNSIVTGNAADANPDISGSFTSFGYNLIGNTAGATFTSDGSDLIAVDARLDETGLAYNGGPVQTVAIFSGSAALDAGRAMGNAGTDARGLARSFDNGAIANATGGDGTDIGAFEAQAAAPEIAVENFDSETDLLSGVTRDIGAVDVGVPTGVNFTVRNKGGATLNLTGNPIVAISGADAGEFSTGQVPSSLAAETAQNFTVLFTPTSTGPKTALLTITSNDADEGTFTVALTATAVDTITAPPSITSPAPFGAVYPMAEISFIIPEAAMSGTVAIAFDNGTRTEFTLPAENETAGSHTVTLNTETAGMTTGDYSLTLTYRDAAGHGPSSTTHSTVHVRPAAPLNTHFLAAGGATASPAPGAGIFSGLPADAVLASFNPPAIDDAGNIAFIAKWTSASGAVKKGTGLFLNGQCLALIGGDASQIAANATWKSFSDPVISGGKAACIAKLSTGASAVVCTFTSSALEKIALTGDAAPGVGDAKFKAFKAVALRNGAIGFLATLSGGTGANKVTAAKDTGIWLREPADPLALVFRDSFEFEPGKVLASFTSFVPGNGSPGSGRGWFSYNGIGLGLSLNSFVDKTKAIGFGGTGGYTFMAKSGDIGTNFAPALPGASFATFGLPAMNDALETAFLATMKAGAGGVTKATAGAIFTTRADFSGSLAPIQFVARLGGDAAAAGAGAKFKLLKDPVLSADGGIAFPATVANVKGLGAQTLWWKPAGQPLQLLAQGGGRPGVDLPAAAQWKSFTSLAIAGGGRGPIFAGTLVPGKGGVLAATATGVWACDFTGAVRTLFRTGDKISIDGDPAHDRMVKSFTLLKAGVGSTGVTRSFNDTAEVVWLATFTDKSQAIVTTEVP